MSDANESVRQVDLRGKIALVTGAGRRNSIGAAVCHAFAACAADIFFTYWQPADRLTRHADAQGPEAIEADVRRSGVRVAGLEADLSLPRAPAQIMDAAVAELGIPSILVNSATHDPPGERAISTIDAADLDMTYAVNVRGMALLAAEFVRRYPGGPGGRIINLTSGQSLNPMPDSLAYATSKGAVEAFTVSLAPSVAAMGITVNAVDPGATETGWITEQQRAAWTAEMAMGRLGRPEDAARLITFLASDAAAWITGQVIHSRGA
ncbi:MAG: SDR family oxidoreductase [Chloroflexota bacterium]